MNGLEIINTKAGEVLLVWANMVSGLKLVRASNYSLRGRQDTVLVRYFWHAKRGANEDLSIFITQRREEKKTQFLHN